jgi:hypothetical protein
MPRTVKLADPLRWRFRTFAVLQALVEFLDEVQSAYCRAMSVINA